MEITVRRSLDDKDTIHACAAITREEFIRLPVLVHEEIVRRLADKIIAEHDDEIIAEVMKRIDYDAIAKAVTDDLKARLTTPFYTIHPATEGSL